MSVSISEKAAGILIEELESRVPAKDQGAAAVDAIETLCTEAMYPVALAFIRRHPGIPETRIYEILMDQARKNGHDEGLVFASAYGQ